MVVPVDIEEGRYQHDICGITSLKLASFQNFGDGEICRRPKKYYKILFLVPMTDPIPVML